VAVQVPVAGVVEIEAAKLQPGLPVVGSGGQVAAEEIDRHVALAFTLERRGAWCHVRVDRALCLELNRGEEPRHQPPRDGAAEPREVGWLGGLRLPGERVHGRLKMVWPLALG
jgi:hypothetical protein